MKDATEEKVKQQLLEDIKRQGVSSGVHKSAVKVLRDLSSKLLKSKRRKNLLFVVLHAAHIDAGEYRSLEELAKDLEIRGKYCNISPRANLIQLKDSQQYSKPLIKTIHIASASDLLEARARKIDCINESHIHEMLKLLETIFTRTPILRDHYPQKVAVSFLCVYAEMNGITLPVAVEEERVHKLARSLKQALGQHPIK